MIRASQGRAPTRARTMLLGTSASTYPRKKIPAANPYSAPLIPKDSSSPNFAKPMLMRSM